MNSETKVNKTRSGEHALNEDTLSRILESEVQNWERASGADQQHRMLSLKVVFPSTPLAAVTRMDPTKGRHP